MSDSDTPAVAAPTAPLVTPSALPPVAARTGYRWFQLGAGIVSLVAVANFQYGWTLFVLPIQNKHGWDRVAIQDAFFICFVLAQTWPVPIEAYLAERFGPRRLLVCGGLLAACGWMLSALAESLIVLNVAQALSGCGCGIAYGICIGNALKWFPARRGLAAGLTAAAFGTGSALTVIPISLTIQHAGPEAALIWFGLGQGLVVVLAGLVTRFPLSHELPTPPNLKVAQTRRDYTPKQVLRSPLFWLLYVMMMLGAIPGLLMMGQMAVIAADFSMADREVALFWGSMAALPLALMVDRIMGGLTRPVFGWISDRIGREPAMLVAFGLEGFALLLFICFPDDPVVFVLTSGLAFFGWGAVFSLFPAAIGDLFGRTFATTNYGLLYTAKGAASLVILALNRLQAATDSWVPVFLCMIAFDWAAALLAVLVLRPMRQRRAA